MLLNACTDLLAMYPPRRRLVNSRHGAHLGSMRSRSRAARLERRQLRQLSKELSTIPGFGEPQRPPPHKAKDFLGAAVTLAILGAIVLQVTDGLASRCGAGLNPRTRPGSCSGMAAVAHHADGIVTLSAIACGALAVLAFIWYLLWGYKTNAPATETQDTPGI